MNNPESVDNPVTSAARSLGRMARGKSKAYTAEERQRRADRMREMNLKRRAKAKVFENAIVRAHRDYVPEVLAVEPGAVASDVQAIQPTELPQQPVGTAEIVQAPPRSAMDQAFIDAGWAVRSNGDYGKMHGQAIRWICSVSGHAGRPVASFSGERFVDAVQDWSGFRIFGQITKRTDWSEAEFVRDIEDYLSEQG